MIPPLPQPGHPWLSAAGDALGTALAIAAFTFVSWFWMVVLP